MIGRFARPIALLALLFTAGTLAAPPPAGAVNVAKPICTLAGLVSGVAGKVCSAASHAGSVLKAGKKLLGGHLGGAIKALTGAGTAAKALTAGAVLTSLVVWVTGGARLLLNATAKVISTTTRPQLQSTWFSSTYWRMAAISALLTLPFLFAAAIQAVLRSDLALLARSTLGYLPLAILAISIAAPVTTLLLAGSDELSAIVSQAAGGAGGAFLARVGGLSVGLSGLSGSTFVVLFVAILTVGATLTLWIELLIRAAAVYVVVLMLPLFFAALVWPARRVWAIRAIELLVALILSKFAIVAVLSLGGAALGHTAVPSPAQMLEGATLVLLAAFSPWALLRLLPLHELTTSLEGLRSRPQSLAATEVRTEQATEVAHALLRQLPAGMQSDAAADHAGPAEAVVRSVGANAAPDPEESGANGVGPSQQDRGGARSPVASGSAGRSSAASGSRERLSQPATSAGEMVGSTGGPTANGAGAPASGRAASAPDEPLAADEPLALSEPPAPDEPLTLGEPPAPDEPLILGEPHAPDEPLALGEAPAPDDPPLPHAEPRFPGMDPLYQQDNYSWPTIQFPEDFLAPDAGHDSEAPPGPSSRQAPERTPRTGPGHVPERPPDAAGNAREPAPPTDDHDARPPAQDPADGRL